MAKKQLQTSKDHSKARQKKSTKKRAVAKQPASKKKARPQKTKKLAPERSKPSTPVAGPSYNSEGPLSGRVSVQELRDAGFFAYAKDSIPPLSTLTYGGMCLGASYAVTDKAGKTHGVRRVFGADVEELVEHGLSWFFTDDLSHLGIDPSAITENFDGTRREWSVGGNCYVIPDASSAYDRAAFALIAILNQILEEAESDERAYGVNEGNAFGVAFLTEPLYRIISAVADDDEKPVTQEQLRQMAQAAIRAKEPPLFKARNK